MHIVHLADPQTFTKSFFSFIEKKFNADSHQIITHSNSNQWPDDIKIKNSASIGLTWVYNFIIATNNADKIIIHGLWDIHAIVLLAFQPWTLRKCYWLIWGGDLYAYRLPKHSLKQRIIELFRRFVIKKIGYLVTYIEGDVALARKWYSARGQYIECLMYLSNVFHDYRIPQESAKDINIQIGNSADPSNNHIEILEKLSPYREQNINIHVPLSYGNAIYAKSIIEIGEKIFGSKFKPLTEFIPFDEYLIFLGKIDIAIFNHQRQQAMGNTITLLGLGKKVYIRDDVTQKELFERAGIKVYSTSNINIDMMPNEIKQNNCKIIKNFFSEDKLFSQLKNLFKE